MIATTIEMSKRLLKAGLDKDSADMWKTVCQLSPRKVDIPMNPMPIWSLSALWKEVSKIGKFAFQETDTPEEIIESLVTLYEEYKNRKKNENAE